MIQYTVDNIEYKLSEIKLLKSTLRPMATYYEKLAEYYNENPDDLIDEEMISQYENSYNTFINKLEKELEYHKDYQSKVENSKWGFSIK